MIAGVTVMGIVNVTPDSFSDGGDWHDPDAAIAHGLQLWHEGADIVDVGGESTRPGAEPVSMVEEQRRVIPVIHALADAGVAISIDTVHAETAQAAVTAGASIVNDVSGGLFDDGMLAAVARMGVRYVVMHWRGPLLADAPIPHYADVVGEVEDHLRSRVAACLAAGIAADHIILDPGLGFSKTAAHNWALLRAQRRLASIGYPVLIGASRKRFLAALIAETGGDPKSIALRDDATANVSLAAAERGVWGVRVHNVAATRTALAVRERMMVREGAEV